MPSLYSFQAPFPIQSLIVLNLFVSFVALIVIYTRLTVGEKLGEEAADLVRVFRTNVHLANRGRIWKSVFVHPCLRSISI